MVEALFERIMEDVTKICKLSNHLDVKFTRDSYDRIRNTLIDVLGEMELGAEINWDELSSIMPRLVLE